MKYKKESIKWYFKKDRPLAMKECDFCMNRFHVNLEKCPNCGEVNEDVSKKWLSREYKDKVLKGIAKARKKSAI